MDKLFLICEYFYSVKYKGNNIKRLSTYIHIKSQVIHKDIMDK